MDRCIMCSINHKGGNTMTAIQYFYYFYFFAMDCPSFVRTEEAQ